MKGRVNSKKRRSNSDGSIPISDSESLVDSLQSFDRISYRDSEDSSDIGRVISKWEKYYSALDRANSKGNFKEADNLCNVLLDATRWPDRILRRSWSTMPDGSIRAWGGCAAIYAKEYRLIDGIREAWTVLLMNYAQWDRAVFVADQCLDDVKCISLSSKAQVAIHKLHSLLESRRIRDALHFRDVLFSGSSVMNGILRCIEESFPYEWHYALARINFLHHDMDKARHHSEAACGILEANQKNEREDEPFQSRLWVFVIRAYTRGLACLSERDYSGLGQVLHVWDRTVCDLDRKSLQNIRGLKEQSVFGRLMYLEFINAMLRACSELDIRSYTEDYLNNPSNKDKVELNKDLTMRLRSITSELQRSGLLSLEVCSSRYDQALDHAVTEAHFLSINLQGLVDNWTLIVDAGPIGNQARYANHCDDPNAALALGASAGIRVRTIKAIKPINKGDEITVHYGPSYWDPIKESRTSELSKRYNCTENRGSLKKKSSSSSSIYKLQTQSKFTFFDGIVNDVNCSGLPAEVLLHSMGAVDEEALDMDASSRLKGLRILNCPKGHAAYPGKMLVADKDFAIGDEICIYAGLLIKAPARRLDLRESDYAVTICNSTCGPYGFELEDVKARNGCVFKKNQPSLPAPPLDPSEGLRIRHADPPVDLSGIEDIKGLGKECTQLIITALQNDAYHDLLRQIFRRLYRLPDKNWKHHAVVEIKKSFASFHRRILTAEEQQSSVFAKLEQPPPTEIVSQVKSSVADVSMLEDRENIWTVPNQLRSQLKRSLSDIKEDADQDDRWDNLERMLLGN